MERARNDQRHAFYRHSSPSNERNDANYGRLNEGDSTIQRLRNSMESLLRELGVEDNMAAKTVNTQPMHVNANTNSFGSFNFRDIEHALNSFNGRDNYRIEIWFEEFEEYAQMFKWNDLQKLLFVKRMMKDSAKLFLRTKKTMTYGELKQVLLREYGKKRSSAEIHKLMQSKKKKSDENLREYALRMLEIGVSNRIDEQSVIQYVIDGIDDDQSNKIILYGAKTYDQLKLKMDDYEKFKSSFSKKKDDSNKQTSKSKSIEKPMSKKKFENKGSHCFLCGETTHMMSSCPTKEKGAKCFKCLEFGHKASDNVCQKKGNKKEEKSYDRKVMCISAKPRAMKIIEVNGLELKSLIDTGSDINAIRERVFRNLNIAMTKCAPRNFTGAGGAALTVKGYFEGNLFIDDDYFSTIVYVCGDADIPADVVVGNELIYEINLCMEKAKSS